MKRWSEMIPFACVAYVTTTETYAVAEDCYICHAELDVINVNARLNIRIQETNGRWIELAEIGATESAELTWQGSQPLKARQVIQLVARADENAAGEMKLVFTDQPGTSGNIHQTRSLENALVTLTEYGPTTSVGAGATEISTDLDNHQIVYVRKPIQVRQVSGGALEVRLYLKGWSVSDGAYTNILIHTEAAVANNAWTTCNLVNVDLPLKLSDIEANLVAEITAGGAAETIEMRFFREQVTN